MKIKIFCRSEIFSRDIFYPYNINDQSYLFSMPSNNRSNVKPKSIRPAKPKVDAKSIKGITQRKRKVFKPILSNPYTLTDKWPSVGEETSQSILRILTEYTFKDVGNYNKIKSDVNSNTQLKLPEESKYICNGFNSTMKLLEHQIYQIRKKVFDPQAPDSAVCVFVCKSDITSSLLSQPFPLICCIAKVKLVELPRGSAKKLQQSLGLRTGCEIITLKQGIMKNSPALEKALKDIEDVKIDFLDGQDTQLGMKLQFMMVDQPTGKRPRKRSQNKKGTK